MPLPEISDILNLREKFDVNQKQLAKLVGVDYAWLSHVLTGRIEDPSYKKMKKIFDYLEMRQYQGERVAGDICARPIYTAKLGATLGIVSQEMRNKAIKSLKEYTRNTRANYVIFDLATKNGYDLESVDGRKKLYEHFTKKSLKKKSGALPYY